MTDRTTRDSLSRAGARIVPLALVLLLAAAACVRGTLPPREYYGLPLPDSLLPRSTSGPAPGAAAAPLDGTIAVDQYRAPGLYGEPNIVFRLGESKYGQYPSREWMLPLGEQLGLMTEAVLRRAPLARGGALYDPPNMRTHTYLWRGTIREFEEVNRNRTVLAAVRLEALVLRASDDSVVWRGSVRLERPVPQPTMQAIVDAMSDVALEAISELVRSAQTELAAGGRAAAGTQR